jgi:hypothetical protein
MSSNGRLLDSELTWVTDVERLANGTANAWKRLQAACKAATGLDLWIASPAGAYRDYFTQGDMHVHPEKYGLNPNSTVPIAAAGYSTHGYGTRVDIGSFSGARATWLLAHASEFGWYREFGANDPNHFAHDGFTAVDPILTGSTSGTTTPIDTGEIEMTYEEFRDFLSRALKYDAREFQTSGPTIWERFAVLVTASRKADPTDETPVAGGVTGWIAFRNASWRFLKYHSRQDGPDGKGRTLFEQLNDIETAVKANGTVKLELSDASAELIASKVAAKIGPSAL